MLNLKPKTKKVLIVALVAFILFTLILFIGGTLGNGTFKMSQWDGFGRGVLAMFYVLGLVIELCIVVAYYYEEEVRRG